MDIPKMEPGGEKDFDILGTLNIVRRSTFANRKGTICCFFFDFRPRK